MRLFYTLILLLVAFVLPTAWMSAEGALCFSEDSLHVLDELVVEARSPKETIPAQKLDAMQLARLASTSLADALRYLAGVKVKDYGGMGGLKTIDVRNMGAQQVGVFYDGVQVGNAQNGIVDLGRFSLDDVEEVALYNGQRSETGQTARDYASSSALYLRARKPNFSDGERTKLTLRYKMGTIQLVNPSLRWEQRLSDRLSLAVGGEYLYSDGRYRFRYRRLLPSGEVAHDTVAIRRNSDIRLYRIEGGLYARLPQGYWHGKLYYYASDRGLPGAIVKNVWHTGERLGDKNFFAQTAYVYEPSPKYRMQWQGKFAYDYTHYLSRDTTSFLGEVVTRLAQYDNRYYQQEYYLSTSHSYRPNRHWETSLSVDYQYNALNATMKGINLPFAYPRRSTLWAALATALQKPRYQLHGSLLFTYAYDKTKTEEQLPKRMMFSPAFFGSLRLMPNQDFYLRGFYKHTFRLPTFNDLYYTQIGYARLRPEVARQLSLGLEYSTAKGANYLRSLQVKVDAYYAWITDKIIAAPTGSSFRWMMSNMGKVISRGVDAVLATQMQFADWALSTRLSYSYSRAQDYTEIRGVPLSSYGHQIPYTPWHSGSLATTLGYKSWTLSHSLIYVGGRYNGAVNNIQENYLQPWYTHDLVLSHHLQIPWGKLVTSLEVNNLLNADYDVVLNYPMPGRNARLVLKMTI